MLSVRGIGSGCQRQDVDFGAQLLETFLVLHAESMLLINDEEAEPIEPDRALQQPMRADHDVDASGVEPGKNVVHFLGGPESRQRLDAHRPVRKAIGEGLIVLLSE